jgi:hypothetical protein
METSGKKNQYGVRKQVGHGRRISPLQRAFRLNRMLEELRGPSPDEPHANVRRVVGKARKVGS